MSQARDASYMAEAIRLAEQGLYTTHPNPRVGSVIVRNDKVVGRGFHLQAGQHHAEAAALLEAGTAAAGATVYCTLEPCSYVGRTPSCAESLIAAGVARVVVAMEDPHPRNAGRGLAMLREAGIAVECGLLAASARALNPGHIKRFEQGLPFVRVKLAMSLDGKTALANGRSQWITGPAARRDVQKLRARSSALVTGVQTVNDDNPSLTVRAEELDAPEAALSAILARPIVVLDPRLRIERHASLLANPNLLLACLKATAGATDQDAGELAGITLLPLDDDGQGRIELTAVLRELAVRDCNEVLFECGATLAGAVVESGLADEIIIYAAPTFLGADARSLLNMRKLDSMHARTRLELTDVRKVGQDLRLTLVPQDR